ncbi:MAG: DNA methyltransferase [Cucumibacter sp.]
MSAPGQVRDSIINYLRMLGRDASASEITAAVAAASVNASSSSVRSYLALNSRSVFERTGRGRYRLRSNQARVKHAALEPVVLSGAARLYLADCFDWFSVQAPNSIHAIVTDPPYGLVEYSAKEQGKLRAGKGGVWRIPPSFDGHMRSPLPRFTTLTSRDHEQLSTFFLRLGHALMRVCVPGANVVIASNPLLVHRVAGALAEAGLEIRGTLARLVMTMRGGDRPKNAHVEFDEVSVMPRSMYEPWLVLRKPLEGRSQDSLRKWRTGGFRRLSADQPFGDVLRSGITPVRERRIAPHPSLKPQAFLRAIVRASLPLGEGIVCDPFAGSGSTLAAATAIGYQSVGVERDKLYVDIARTAIPRLASLSVEEIEPA